MQRCSLTAQLVLDFIGTRIASATSSLVSPAWLGEERQARVMAWHAAIGQRADDAFTLAERIRIFESIGPEDDETRRRIAEAIG